MSLRRRIVQRLELGLEMRYLAIERVGDGVPDQFLADPMQVGKELVLRFVEKRFARSLAVERLAAGGRVRGHDALLVRARGDHARGSEHELPQVLCESLSAAFIERGFDQYVVMGLFGGVVNVGILGFFLTGHEVRAACSRR